MIAVAASISVELAATDKNINPCLKIRLETVDGGEPLEIHLWDVQALELADQIERALGELQQQI